MTHTQVAPEPALPADAPPAGSCVKLERPESGVVVLRLDPPHRKLAVLDLPLVRDLETALTQLELESGLRGLVITGASPDRFAAGADVDAIHSVTDRDVARQLVRRGQELFERIARLTRREPSPVTVVAACGGAVPGGAFELSLACSCIVLTDDKRSRIGLPETRLGIVPGWGGCNRLPRRVGLPKALAAILGGKLYVPRQALKLGLVDRLTKPEYLLDVATDIAAGRKPNPRKGRGVWGWLIDKNPIATTFIASQARKSVLAQTRGHYPAPIAALEIASRAGYTSLKDGFEAEADAVAQLATGSVAKNLIGIFKMTEEAKKLGKLPDGGAPAPVERAGVVGAGVMGGAIASLFAERGVQTRLSDLSGAALDEALIDHRKEIEGKRRRKRLRTHEAVAAVDRLDTSRGATGLARADLVLEAVAERLDVKRAVLGGIAEQLAPDALIVTNTSSLSVDDIAAELPRPDRVVGMHFFNPVRRMPLVEVVRGERTSDEAVTRVAALALKLGKTPVVVADCAGFLVNRLLGPYLDEALRLFDGGVAPDRLDRLAEDFGMPMGPLALLDEVGFDIASHAAVSLHEAYGMRMQPTGALKRIMSEQRLGKKTRHGFYLHGQGPKRKGRPDRTLCADLERFTTGTHLADLTDQDVTDRLILAMLAEGLRSLEEEIVASASELDLATIFGMGFPPFRGGLMAYADARGHEELVQRMQELAGAKDVAEREGGRARFEPPALLLDRAVSGRPLRE